jgi:hypothetical protein
MATPIVHGNTTETGSIIAGYFQSGEDAHRAINALLDEGFLAGQIGAAFHTSSSTSSFREEVPVLGGDSTRAYIGTTVSQGTSGIPESISGAASDTLAVQPGALIGGAGTPFGGAGKPGPISGSSLEGTGLPSELDHELPRDGEVASSSSTAPAASLPDPGPVAVPTPKSGSGTQHHTSGSWTSKLRHLFTSDKGGKTSDPAVANAKTTSKEAQNFGTGEGKLNLRAYSATRFETAATGAGIDAENSRHLARRLAAGGAIVTVSVTGRAPEVERIFERYNGVVKFESGNFNDPAAVGEDSQFEVFGNLENHYPGRA